MLLSNFSYMLPEELIAKYPSQRRVESRLLYVNRDKIQHKKFYEITEFIKPNDLLVLNNTKVIQARLYGEKETGGKIEILVEKILNNHEAWVHCRASKRPKLNQKLFFENNLGLVKEDKDNLLRLAFENNIWDILNHHGHIPLPPYINRQDEKFDRDRYQTVYAKHDGSVAAPTAGLHFDEELLAKFNTAYITLHVGAGTFQPVKDLATHIMHAEYAEISEDVNQKIISTKNQGGRIIAVGTTTTRTLETAKLKPFCGETRLFIKPGFKFDIVDAMITNFHLPESTLLMLVCAFGGYENIMYAYQEAIKEKYRFFSYDDAMFVEKN